MRLLFVVQLSSIAVTAHTGASNSACGESKHCSGAYMKPQEPQCTADEAWLDKQLGLRCIQNHTWAGSAPVENSWLKLDFGEWLRLPKIHSVARLHAPRLSKLPLSVSMPACCGPYVTVGGKQRS